MAKYRPRLTIELTPKTKRGIDSLLAYGDKRKVFEALSEALLELSKDEAKWRSFMGRVVTKSVDLSRLA